MGKGDEGGEEPRRNKRRTPSGFVRHAACKDAARTRDILPGEEGLGGVGVCACNKEIPEHRGK